MSDTIQSINDDLSALGCGDSSCTTVSPRGMHTNGGCRCPWAGRDRHAGMDAETARKVRLVLSLYRRKVKLLEAAK